MSMNGGHWTAGEALKSLSASLNMSTILSMALLHGLSAVASTPSSTSLIIYVDQSGTQYAGREVRSGTRAESPVWDLVSLVIRGPINAAAFCFKEFRGIRPTDLIFARPHVLLSWKNGLTVTGRLVDHNSGMFNHF
jgi:hypothetical protein